MLVKHREALYQGDKDSIFDILTWLFSQQQQQPGLLHKRAFVGYYLGGIDVSLISTPSRTLCTAFRAAALLADISQLPPLQMHTTSNLLQRILFTTTCH